MALAFFGKLDAAVLCAIEISKAIRAEKLCKIRMGINTGPVFVMNDINGKRNISGAGINRAERVMSCGDDGHILLADNVADSLRHLSWWSGKIHPIGECQVKDGWVRVWNLIDGAIGNPEVPKKARKRIRRRRWMIAADIAALVLVLSTAAAGGAFWLMRRGGDSSPRTGSPSIAVLRFTDATEQHNMAYLSDGLAEDLVSELTKAGLNVAGTRSSFQIKEGEKYPVIGQKLHVASVLEGSVWTQGSRLRVNTHLIKCADGYCQWTNTYERDTGDLWTVRDEIARAVTDELKVKLVGLKPARRPNPDAYNAFLQGQYLISQPSEKNLTKAVTSFQQAVKLDPGYAPAWLGLGDSYGRLADGGYAPLQETYGKAQQAVDRAIALDGDLGSAYAVRGWQKMMFGWDWHGADVSYHRALALDPNNVRAIEGAGALAKVLGRLDEAIALYRRVTSIDPLRAGGFCNFGLVLHFAGRNEEAEVALRKALELAPDLPLAHSYIARIKLAQSNLQEALAEAEKEQDTIFRPQVLALVHYALGNKQQSDANLNTLIAKFSKDAPDQIAEVYAFRREADLSFEWLERAYVARDPGLGEMKGDPLLKNLEKDPRFTAFLQKLHLPV